MKKIILGVSAITMMLAANAQSDCGTRYRDQIFGTVTTTSDLTYSVDSPNLQIAAQDLDIYEPQGDTASSRPAIIFIHGGAFTHGSKTDAEIVTLATNFAKRGYVSVAINYNLYTGSLTNLVDSLIADSTTLRASSDTKAAIRFLRENASTYKIDANNIYMVGNESGGIVSLNSTFLNDISKADAVLSGIINGLGGGHGLEGVGGHYGFSSEIKVLASLGGGLLHTNWIDTTTNVPTLLVQADNNMDAPNSYLVPYLDCSPPIGGNASYNLCGSVPIKQRLAEVGINHQLYTFVGTDDLSSTGGEPWITGSPQNLVIVDSLITAFFYPYSACGQEPTLGLKTIENNKVLSVFPNPAQNVINIAVEGIAENEIQSVHLFNLLGQTIYSGKATSISTQNLNNGLYIVEVSFKNNQRAVKRIEVLK